MKRAIPRLYTAVAMALLAAIFAANVYRARAQAITTDEAFEYNLFLAGPLSDMFQKYDASNHVLQTLLSKLSITLFGVSEFTLRLPVVLGGLFYLAVVYRLCRYLFGRGAAFLLCFAVVALNPFVLDYLSAARGYGLALAFLMWGLYEILRFGAERAGVRRLYAAALALALSVASNLAFLFPCAALAVLVMALLAWQRELELGISRFLVPGVVTAFLLVVLPLSRASPDAFYYGAPSLRVMLDSMLGPAFSHDTIPVAALRWLSAQLVILARLLAVAVPMAGVAVVAVSVRRAIGIRAFRALGKQDQFLFWCVGTMLGALGAVIAAHAAFGVPYPLGRTGLYFAPLFTLACFALLERAQRTVRGAGLALSIPVAVVFACQLGTLHYAEWPDGEVTRRLIETLEAHHERHPKPAVTLGAAWQLEASLNFYRQVYNLRWLRPIDRKEPDGAFDYFALLKEQTGLVARRKLVELYRDPASGIVLAAAPR